MAAALAELAELAEALAELAESLAALAALTDSLAAADALAELAEALAAELEACCPQPESAIESASAKATARIERSFEFRFMLCPFS